MKEMEDKILNPPEPESLEELSGEWMRQQLDDISLEEQLMEPAADSNAPKLVGAHTSADLDDSGLLQDLASSVSRAIAGPMLQMERHRSAALQQFQDSVQTHAAQLTQVFEKLSTIQRTVEDLAGAIMDRRREADGLRADLDSLRDASEKQVSATVDLKSEVAERGNQVNERSQELAEQIESQADAIAKLSERVDEVSPRLQEALDGISQHAESLRAIEQKENTRREALKAMQEVLLALAATEAAPSVEEPEPSHSDHD